tara:strand:+ start:56353 stop:57078 length:726 start_codon:yes stop_codon:yes gene_type:complete
MTTIQEKTVGEIVTENIKAAHIFKKYGIDFCCGGGISIKKACDKAKINPSLLEADLLNLDVVKDSTTDYDNWKIDFLADHIINIHHTYVSESSTLLLQYSERVNQVHGHHYTELNEIELLVKKVVQELATHMKKEELILFPFIKKLVAAERENGSVPMIPFGTVENPIKMMEAEHEEAGEIMRQIRWLTNNYTPPQKACNTYKALYSKLEEFEQDLHQHVHLENNILFPKALKLEQALANK